MRCFENHRIADFCGLPFSLRRIADRTAAPAQHGHLRSFGDFASRDLVTQLVQCLNLRSDKHDPGVSARLREVRILGQKSVTRMNRVDLVLLRQRDDGVNIEVRLNRLARFADFIRLIRLEPVQCMAVFVRIDRHGANSQFMGAAENSDGNLAAVGGKQSCETWHELYLGLGMSVVTGMVRLSKSTYREDVLCSIVSDESRNCDHHRVKAARSSVRTTCPP